METEVDSNPDQIQATPVVVDMTEDDDNEISEEKETPDMESVNPQISEEPGVETVETVIPSQEPEVVPAPEEETDSLDGWDGSWNLWSSEYWIDIDDMDKDHTYQLPRHSWGWFYQSGSTWRSSNEKVATVDQYGLVTLHQTGVVIIEEKYTGIFNRYIYILINFMFIAEM